MSLPQQEIKRGLTNRISMPLMKPVYLPVNQLKERNKILASLPYATLERVKRALQPVTLQSGTTIYHPDDFIDYVYFPETCVASRLSLLEDGSTVEIGIIGNEGLVGVSSFIGATLARNWTVVEVGGNAYKMRVSAFREILQQNSDLYFAIASYYNSFFMQVSQRAVCRSRHTLMEQLCSWLLMVKDRTSSNQMPLTHEAIAHRLGTRRAGITVAANTLRKEKIIDYTRGYIVLRDRTKLENFACECYNTLKANDACALQASFLH